jgi:hypothetical protein
MQTKQYSTSVNIIRDKNKSLNYIPTPNSKRVVEQINRDFKKGLRCFNVIGSYGTGKSAFLWAFQQSLSNNKPIFKIDIVKNPNVEILNFIGEYKSLLTHFADYFEVKAKNFQSENIFSEIFNLYHKLGKNNPLLIIAIDEFGKFLEYASENSPEKELFFIQQLAEFANNPSYNILLVTTIHQNFDAYAYKLNSAQKIEWTKVKGRFREITFNEPIEQLLFLASEFFGNNNLNKIQESKINSIAEIAIKAQAFNINQDYTKDIAKKLFPLDIVSANIITLALQRYGQNERSLFSFLESTDNTGLNQFKESSKDNFYSITQVFDYLIFNFYSFINSKYNTDYISWQKIKDILDLVEREFETDINDCIKIVKTIGLLNIFCSKGAFIDKNFLVSYAKYSLNINKPDEIIKILESKKIIIFRKFNRSYALLGGTDIDVHSEIDNKEVDSITDIPTILKKYFDFPQILAKQYSFLKGTPRIFEYVITDEAISNKIPKNETDGFINLIFKEGYSNKKLIEISSNEKEAIFYGYYKNTGEIKSILIDIEKTVQVIDEQTIAEDKVAVKELNNILVHLKKLLSHKVSNTFNSKEVKWFYKGEEVKIRNKTDFNRQLTQICLEVYPSTPKFINELVNKHKISTSIHTAKKNYFKALVNNWNEEDLGFEAEKFPPEKTIYLSLLKENNISILNESLKVSKHFEQLWKVSNKFLLKTKKGKIGIIEFIEELQLRPFKIKQGVIDFWVPSFLFIKRDEFALFHKGMYMPEITDHSLELLAKYPTEFEIKAFDIDGVNLNIFNKYRIILNQPTTERAGNKTFIETIKPFLVFYSGLQDYAKNTIRLNTNALAIRSAIAKSKDPEKTFFEDFPMALGFSITELTNSKSELVKYTNQLQTAIKDIRSCYDELLNRFETFIKEQFTGQDIAFEKYKLVLQQRFSKLKKHLLLSSQKTFIMRIDSPMDDRNAWLNSLAQSLVGKSLDMFSDTDEVILYDKFNSIILDLDSLTKLSIEDINENEEALDIQINSFVDGLNKKIIRLPKSKTNDLVTLESALRKKLIGDKATNIVAIANILKELLKS